MDLTNFYSEGFIKFKNAIQTDKVEELKKAFDKIINKKNPEVKNTYFYLAHEMDETYLHFLDHNPVQNSVDHILGETCIIHSFNGITLKPNFSNKIQNKIHRDTQRFCRPYLLSVQLLIMLDNFTNENGATYILPKSHLIEKKPSDDFFYKNALQLEGKAGDIVMFDSLCWHAGGTNLTSKERRALTLVYTRSFMKQQIDLTTNESVNNKIKNNQNIKRLLGYNVRVPKNIEEFNSPERLYKKNQG